MSDEAAFLNAIVAYPTDNAPRLVYADWLNERDDPDADAKASFLRDTARLMTATGRQAKRIWKRLHVAARSLSAEWLAVVSRVSIENCATRFEFRCPKQWEELKATDDLTVRMCGECNRAVHYCSSIGAARRLAHRGECVAVELGVPRTPNDLEPRRMLLGKIAPSRRPL